MGFPTFFGPKSNFGWGGGENFIPNADHLLNLTYPENFSAVRLMVGAVDTFHGDGEVQVPVVII